jgi:DNA-binding SARP family transcriptional activator
VESTDRLLINVLGPLTVTRGTDEITVGPTMVRTLLGLLALHAGTAVPRDDIVETLWDGEPPTTYLNLIQGYVSRLRAQLRDGSPGASDGLIVNVRGGYRLNVDDDVVDAARFGWLLREARRGAAGGAVARAADLYETALGCWRGPVLADLGQCFERLAAVVAVNERRVTAAVEYGRLCRRLHRYEPAAEVLRTVAEDAPLHEALHAQLMALLAASGNRAAALTLYDRTRRRLADELGVDPGPELRELHLQLLRQDAPPPQRSAGVLADPGGTAAPVEPPPPLPRSARPRVRWAVPAAGLLTALLVAAGIGLNGGSITGRPVAAQPAVSTPASAPPPVNGYTTPVHWHWAFGRVAVTATSEQWATASLTGLANSDSCAGFQLRVGTAPKAEGEPGGVLLAVCPDKWELEGPGDDFMHVDHHFGGTGVLRVTLSAANVLTLSFDGTVVTTLTLRGSYPGHGIAPAIYQGDAHVVMDDLRWNAARWSA